MPLEFGDGFCTPCEPSARVWHNGNDPRRPIAGIIVMDVNLNRSIAISLLDGYLKWTFHSHQWMCCREQQSGERPQRSSLRSCWDIEDGRSGWGRGRKNSAQTQETFCKSAFDTDRGTRSMCALVYFYIHASPCLGFPTFSLLRVLFVFLTPRWFTGFGEWARLSSMLVLYGTYRPHDEKTKSVVSAECAYGLMLGGTWRTWEPTLTLQQLWQIWQCRYAI